MAERMYRVKDSSEPTNDNSWFKIHRGLLDDYEIHCLGLEEYVRLFEECIAGKKNIFSKYIKGPFNRPQEHEWRIIRTRIFKRDNYTCQYCGERGVKIECDHVIPVSKGGSSTDDNLKTACFKCNRSKRDKTLSEWRCS